MKCKRIIKVVSALALTVALLVSTGVVSFAATYTTTTTYLNQDTIEVTSKAAGLYAGNMATYVAYNNDSFNEANAVYIDQATAGEDGTVEFVYQTNSDNVKATVKFGGSTESKAQDANIEGYRVNVTVDGVAAGSVIVPEVDAAYDSDYLAREIPVTVAAGSAVDSVAVNGTPVEVWYVKDGVVVIYSNVILDDAEVAITTKAVEAKVVLGTVKAEAGKITAFARATCADDADYGILVGGDATLEGAQAWDAATDYNTAVKLPALGMGNDGGFCVEVQDDLIVAGSYNVAAYAGEEVTAAKVAVVE